MIVDQRKDFVDDEMVELHNEYLHLLRFRDKTMVFFFNKKKDLPEIDPRLSLEYCWIRSFAIDELEDSKCRTFSSNIARSSWVRANF